MVSISGLSGACSSKEAVDVGILTVIPAELFAVLNALGINSESTRERHADGTVYYRGVIRSELRHRDYRIIVSCIGGAGNPGAAAATRDMICAYRARMIVLVGIAAGIRGKIKIGNVVLSTRVVSYEPAALIRTADGRSIEERRPEIDRAPHAIKQDLINYLPDPERLRAIFLDAGGAFPQPFRGEPEAIARVFHEHVAQSITVCAATMASGEKLLRDPTKLLYLRDNIHGNTEVAEMEGAGIVEACRRGNVPWLVMRGISDFGDELKDDRFHDLASRAAAAAVADFLAHGLDLRGSASSRAEGRKTIWLASLGLLVALGGATMHDCIRPRTSRNALATAEPAFPWAACDPSGLAATPGPSVADPTSDREANEGAKACSAVAGDASTRTPDSSARGETRDIAIGDRGKVNIGAVEGTGAAAAKAGDVTCGRNCEINVGVVVNEK